jgi:sarcosine oxidase
VTTYDTIVVGLGIMGSAAAYSLAERGELVLGLDRWVPPHDYGSTHGRSRIIRLDYFEHPLYVPILRRAYECWHSLEERVERQLLLQTGGLMVGPSDGMLVAGARSSAVLHGLDFEEMNAQQVRRRFPAFAPPDEMAALWEPNAGVLFPEICIESYLDLAVRSGGKVRTGETVTSWSASSGSVKVTTTRATYSGRSLVLAAGPWMPTLLRGLDLPFTVERQEFHWFAPRAHPEHFTPDRCPIALWEYKPDSIWATFPDLGDGVKSGIHHDGEEVVNPDAVRREILPEETARHRELLRRFVPDADGDLREAKTCLYTNTPDGHFVIDFHPDHENVLILSPCSGHGFKFASALGEVVADLMSTGESRFDLSPFRVARFGTAR